MEPIPSRMNSAQKSTELAGITLKSSQEQPFPMMIEQSAHLMLVPELDHPWLPRYKHLLFN